MNTQNNEGATLTAHCGTRKISRAELQEILVPPGTETHQPLSHFELVETLVETLSYRYLKVKRDEYAVSKDGMRMFGVMDLEYGFSGCCYSIGIRNSNDKSMRLAMTAGYRVFVCDNMMFSGEFQPLLYKHTKNLNLPDSLSIAVDRIHRNFEPMKEKVALWQETLLSTDLAKLVIYEAFLDRKLKVPRFLLPVVHDYYFKPQHQAFAEKNLWSLSNAFTSAFKKLKPVQQFAATAKLGAYLEPVASKVTQAKVLEFPINRIQGAVNLSGRTNKPNQTNRTNNSELDDLSIDYDPVEFADDFDDCDEDIEEQIYEDYEDYGNEDPDDKEDNLTRKPLQKAA